jgi:hypothetical protein
MGYVPGCKHDLFISYASENNRDGWVSHFVLALGKELSELLGMRQFQPKECIFFDAHNIQAAQGFPLELSKAARGSAIFVPILSPGYLLSPWCNHERTEFFSQLPLGAEAPNCLAPVLIRPIDETGLDALHRQAQRISFLAGDEQTPLPTSSPEWRHQVRNFAGQLKVALQLLRGRYKPVFVGRSPEIESGERLRTWCRSEIERRHFRTVPESLQVLDEVERLVPELESSGLAIHFLGGANSRAMEAIEISAAVCSGPTLLYQAFSTELTPRERLWLDTFERDLQPTTERYQRLAGKNSQELLSVIDEQFARGPSDTPTTTLRSQVGLVCDKADFEAVRQLQASIREKLNIEVSYPEFVAEQLKAMEWVRRWQDYLSRSEALLFYYGAAEFERLNLIWQTAHEHHRSIRSNWFLAPPDLDTKRLKVPDGLWEIEHVGHLTDLSKAAQQP